MVVAGILVGSVLGYGSAALALFLGAPFWLAVAILFGAGSSGLLVTICLALLRPARDSDEPAERFARAA